MSADTTPEDRPGLATRAVHAGRPEVRPGHPVVAPIVRSSTFHWAGPGDGAELLYSRYGNNPNQRSAAAGIAALEGTESALALASGMAAISMTLLAATRAGDHIVASRHLYGATHALLAGELPRRGITTTFVDPGDPGAWRAAATRRTRVVLIELPTNPTLRVFDIGPPREAARAAGAILAADMTFATPVNIRAAEHGVDAVIHSATKYLGGHSDLIAGAVAGSAELIGRVTHMMKLYGGSIDPQTAWLLERGMRTLPARMERHNRTALALARWFAGRRRGAPGHPSGSPVPSGPRVRNPDAGRLRRHAVDRARGRRGGGGPVLRQPVGCGRGPRLWAGSRRSSRSRATPPTRTCRRPNAACSGSPTASCGSRPGSRTRRT